MFDLCYISCDTELFAELSFSEKSGTEASEVDLYEPVPQNDELQRGQKLTFGQLEVFNNNNSYFWSHDFQPIRCIEMCALNSTQVCIK